METQPHIVFSEWVMDNLSNVDSDIQKNSDFIDFSKLYTNGKDKDKYKNKLIIGFHSNQLSERGTEVAIYDYANHNEKILGNRSIIFYQKNNPNNCDSVVTKFKKRFLCYHYDNLNQIENIVLKENINLMYNMKYGTKDNFNLENCPCINHSVFVAEPHGYKYAVLNGWVNSKYNTNCHIVPHMVDMVDMPDMPDMSDIIKYNVIKEELRKKLDIPVDAIVLGRHGGLKQFDINYVHDGIREYLETNKDIYFLFVNTEKFYSHPNIIYLDKIIDLEEKARFIYTCDAMIHARSDGEIFSLSIGEFCKYNKPIITTYSQIDNGHIEMLKDKAIIYNNKEELKDIFKNIKTHLSSKDFTNPYSDYTPEKVMNIFNDVFLKDYYEYYSSLEFYKELDFVDNDIKFIGRKNIKQLFW